MTFTKQKILQKYKAGLCSDYYRRFMRAYNREMYPSVEKIKHEHCEYYLYPAYIRIDDKFTDEEILDNFYIGDLLEIDLNEGTAEQYFEDTWNKQTGNGKWGR